MPSVGKWARVLIPYVDVVRFCRVELLLANCL
jgi:hypothetical protein